MMISRLDTVVVGVDNLADATADYSLMFGADGVATSFDGRSAHRFTTTNTDLCLVEKQGDRAGMESLVFAVPDKSGALRRLGKVGIDIESDENGLVTLKRENTRSLQFVLCEDLSDSASGSSPSGDGLVGLDHAVIASGDGDYTASLLSARLQLDMRLDLTNPDWDARLMFFRCGDLIVEVYQPLSKPLAPERDRFFGLSWRAGNIDQAHATFTEHGFDVSEVRTGRRPGSRVFTVRDRTHGVPTLVLGVD